MNKVTLRKIFAFFETLILALSCTSLIGCKESALTRTFFTADTVCSITLYDGNEEILNGAVELCNSLSDMLDPDKEDSALYKLNEKGFLENPNRNLYNLIKTAKGYAEASNGRFDPTIRAYTTLWNFKEGVVPEKSALDLASSYVDYQNIVLENNSITLKNNAKLELGAIAKGFISDLICNFLREQQVTSAIINLGGNVAVLGNNDGEKFSIGIQDPKSENVIAVFYAENCSVVTSGTYQRGFEKNGILYHHILNPENGLPITNGLASVTIIAPLGVDADALSTLCFILGEENGKELIENIENTEGVFIDNKNNISLTSGIFVNDKNEITLK